MMTSETITVTADQLADVKNGNIVALVPAKLGYRIVMEHWDVASNTMRFHYEPIECAEGEGVEAARVPVTPES